ncbi:hypothetical protein [Methylotuvimicrobium sp. KM1]|uniref:hypothetical protein n=1 Tax=unclassified Methylotuvimicrobium TaxID=2822412 RepID=UPI00385065AF
MTTLCQQCKRFEDGYYCQAMQQNAPPNVSQCKSFAPLPAPKPDVTEQPTRE